VEEQRKTVTIVFADVTGSTGLGERLDPESLRHVMQRYFDEMRAVLESHGGTVEKFIGDAVMAVFGIPQVHEDDALRGVRAAGACAHGSPT
jgi:class 3 adenylate cyclase